MRLVIARAPTRLDFGGGWTDVPPYSEEQGGVVCNVAISRYATATLRIADTRETSLAPGETALAHAALARTGLTGVSLSVTSDFPQGAGLGGSSAAGVAAMGAIRTWLGQSIADRAVIAEASRAVEVEDLGIAGGRQDHYAAAFGGALKLDFTDITSATAIPLDAETREALTHQCLVFFSGESRISAETITAVLDAYRARDSRVCDALAEMKRLASEMSIALRSGDLERLGTLVGEHWSHQKSLHSRITTPRIEAMMTAASAAGAWGGKALGASGGGCIVLFAPPSRVAAVHAAVEEIGTHIPFSIDCQGLALEQTE